MMTSVCIIGGGFSGTMVAIQLLRRAKKPLKIHLLEKTGRFATGLAYSTRDPLHLLNVRAQNMSAFPDQPSHFVEWLKKNKKDYDATDFVPRLLFQDYLNDLLASNIQAKSPSVEIELVSEDALSVSQQGAAIRIQTTNGFIVADKLVLAMGHFPPHLQVEGTEKLRASGHYISQFWLTKTWDDIKREDRVLIIGSGLSMVDAVISLDKTGHSGPISAVSRRGFLPQVHEGGYEAITPEGPSRGGLRAWTKNIHKEIQNKSNNWRAIMDGMRPITNKVWQSFTLQEQRTFVRHVRPLWETHRHRMAPEIAARIQTLLVSGRLNLVAGRVRAFVMQSGAIDTVIKMRSEDKEKTISADWIVDCSGSENNLRKIDSPLLKSLFDHGLVKLNALGMGVDVKEENIFTIGPLRKGSLWETTAVPELRVQAQEVSEAVLQ